ncbi:MAG: PHP domain-containing protein [Clostridia bacterium]|nr:PHP domain-containing protein [Clostridia bacterium]
MDTPFIVDHDYHIHTYLSDCSSDPEQNTGRILRYAKENGYSSVCITDHFWDEKAGTPSDWYEPQNFEHISKSLPLPEDDEVRMMFGCEADLRADLTLGITEECMDKMDMFLISTTHLHMTGFTISEEDSESAKRRAELWVERLDRVLSMDLPFRKIGLAHLTSDLIGTSEESAKDILRLIPDSTIRELLGRAAKAGVGIELNNGSLRFPDDEAEEELRIFRIAKECGCKFYFGSDAHHPKTFEVAKSRFERAVKLLGLKESDKFVPKSC